MVLKLSSELRDALQHNVEVTLEDELDHRKYVLVPIAHYERLRMLLLQDDFSPTDAAAAQSAVAGAADWDDPEMNMHDNYDQNRRTP